MAAFPDGTYMHAEIRYMYPGNTQMPGAPSATGHIVEGDLCYGVNENWFKKGPDGENVTWYWDSNYTDPVILGQNVDGYEINIYTESMGFVLYGRMEQMNIKWQMGPKPSLENITKEAGSVYFVKDPNRLSEESKSGFGELYYDDEKGNRIKIGGTGISSLSFQILSGSTNDEIQANLILEDGTSIRSGNFPVAGFDGNDFQGGIISTGMQEFYGIKSFTPGIICGTPMDSNDGWINSAIGNPFLYQSGGVLEENILNNPTASNATVFYSNGPGLYLGGTLGSMIMDGISPEAYNFEDPMSTAVFLGPLALTAYRCDEGTLSSIESLIGSIDGREDICSCETHFSDWGYSFWDMAGYAVVASELDGTTATNGILQAIAKIPTFFATTFTVGQIGLNAEIPICQAFIRDLDVENVNVTNLLSTNLTVDTLTIGDNKPSINGTSFDGHSNITTDTWGYSRNFQISATASPNASAGTNINGGDAQNILYIPNVMTNFSSITTATLLADTIGSVNKWSQSYIGSLFLKGTLDTIYHTITSETNSAKTMTIANDSGYFAYAPLVNKNNTLVAQAVGDANSPVYVTAKGCITACSEISTKHGGTGRNIVSTGHILVGADVTAADGKVTNNSMVALAPGAKGSILVSAGADQNPTYITPSLSMPTSTGDTLVVRFSTNENSDITIPNASTSKAGIITTGTQSIAGAKTFTAALTAQKGITVSSGLTVNGTTTFNDGFTTKKDITLTGGKISHSGALTTSATTNLVLEAGSTSGLYLKGGLLVLDSNMYGTGDPPTPTVEGQVYFKIVN